MCEGVLKLADINIYLCVNKSLQTQIQIINTSEISRKYLKDYI